LKVFEFSKVCKTTLPDLIQSEVGSNEYDTPAPDTWRICLGYRGGEILMYSACIESNYAIPKKLRKNWFWST